MIDLAVVIVAYNQADLLRATLRSVIRHTHGVTYTIYVIDNASSDPGVQALRDEFPQVHLIRRDHNLGFAAANNVVIRQQAAGNRQPPVTNGNQPLVVGDRSSDPSPIAHPPSPRYVVLLNPDTLLHADALSALVRWLDDHADVGAVGPQLRFLDGRVQPYSYGAAPSPPYLARRLLAHARGSFLHAWSGSDPIEADWVAGTCLMLRREAIGDVGALDEQFFLYFEDVDYGLRVRRAGWRVVFLPQVAITHLGGATGAASTAHYDRSLVRFYGKWYGGAWAVALWWALRGLRALQRIGRWIR